MKGIRLEYESFGPEEYYRKFGGKYENPHDAQVRALVTRNAHRWDTASGVLDFCAGGGEATLALMELGIQNCVGCDPFTFKLYQKKTGLPCLRFAFNDVLKGASLGQHGVAICSFGLHLCPEKDLFSVTWALLTAAPVLVIITPHKRPELEHLPGISLSFEDFELTDRGKKVRLKEYRIG